MRRVLFFPLPLSFPSGSSTEGLLLTVDSTVQEHTFSFPFFYLVLLASVGSSSRCRTPLPLCFLLLFISFRILATNRDVGALDIRTSISPKPFLFSYFSFFFQLLCFVSSSFPSSVSFFLSSCFPISPSPCAREQLFVLLLCIYFSGHHPVFFLYSS